MFRIAALTAVVVFCQGQALAFKGKPKAPTGSQLQQEAEEHYTAGIKHRDKAEQLGQKAQAAGDPEKAEKLGLAASKEYRAAVDEYRAATQKDPAHYRAFASLGYAYRKLGDYQTALEFYARSLRLKPDYPEAIEYRAEAYLALNRADDARRAYGELEKLDPSQAAILLAAMNSWIALQRSQAQDAAGTQELEQFALWVQERDKNAASSKKSSRW